MKEIINAVIVVVGLWGGTRFFAEFYRGARQAALEKASQGLPSLVEMNNAIHGSKHSHAKRSSKPPDNPMHSPAP